METIKLKNGSKELKIIVTTTILSLKQLLKENPLAFYELVQVCSNPSHKVFSPVQLKAIESLNLISGGVVNSSIRNIVLSAVEGEGLGMTIGNPLDPKS